MSHMTTKVAPEGTVLTPVTVEKFKVACVSIIETNGMLPTEVPGVPINRFCAIRLVAVTAQALLVDPPVIVHVKAEAPLVVDTVQALTGWTAELPFVKAEV